MNRAWGVAGQPEATSKIRILSLFLIILCGGLALGSVLLTAVNTKFVTAEFGLSAAWWPIVIFRIAAIPVTILSLLLVYWLLPNRSVPVRRVLPVAVLVGIGLEVWKYLFLFAWPWLDRKFTNEYGPFNYSVSIVVFSLPDRVPGACGSLNGRPVNHRQPRTEWGGASTILPSTSIARREKALPLMCPSISAIAPDFAHCVRT